MLPSNVRIDCLQLIDFFIPHIIARSSKMWKNSKVKLLHWHVLRSSALFQSSVLKYRSIKPWVAFSGLNLGCLLITCCTFCDGSPYFQRALFETPHILTYWLPSDQTFYAKGFQTFYLIVVKLCGGHTLRNII